MQDCKTRILLALIAAALWGLLLRPAFEPASATAAGPRRTWMRFFNPTGPDTTTWVDLEQASAITFGKDPSGPMASIFAPGRSAFTRDPKQVERLQKYVSSGVLPR